MNNFINIKNPNRISPYSIIAETGCGVRSSSSFLLHILIVFTLLIIGCEKPAVKKEIVVEEVAIPVQIEPFATQPFDEIYHGIGRVESIQKVNLIFEIPGKVTRIMRDIGDVVSKNQALAEIEKDQYEANFLLAEAAKKKAENDMASSKELLASNIVSRDQHDLALVALKNSQAGYIQAKSALDNTILRAPFDGTIIHRNLEIGAIVSPANLMNPAFVIADMNHLKVVVQVPESMIGQIEVGQPAKIKFKTFDQKIFSGKVYRIGLATLTLSNTFEVELLVEDPGHDLRLGLIANANIIVNHTENGIVLPIRLIHDDQGEKYIYTESENRARRIPVTIQSISGSNVLVQGAIKNGDRLIVRGHNDVNSGSLLRVVAK